MFVSEFESLVVKNKTGLGKRVVSGIEPIRFNTLMAIVEKHFHYDLGSFDIYFNILNGIKHSSRLTDLAVIASVISSLENKPFDSSNVFFGEINFSGEIILNKEKLVGADFEGTKFKLVSQKSSIAASMIGLDKINDLKGLLVS